MNSHDSVPSNEKLKEAIRNAFINSNVLESERVINQIKSITSVKVAKVERIYMGIGKMDVILEDENKLVEAIYTYPLTAQNMMISFLPKGTEHIHNGLHCIHPRPRIYVNVLHTDDSYVVLGFNRKSSSESLVKGEISIKYGRTEITLTEDYININTPHLFVNGVPHEAKDREDLIEEIIEEIDSRKEEEDGKE